MFRRNACFGLLLHAIMGRLSSACRAFDGCSCSLLSANNDRTFSSYLPSSLGFAVFQSYRRMSLTSWESTRILGKDRLLQERLHWNPPYWVLQLKYEPPFESRALLFTLPPFHARGLHNRTALRVTFMLVATSLMQIVRTPLKICPSDSLHPFWSDPKPLF